MASPKPILVLGAGVSGLSTGILLLKAGYKVRIWAKEVSPDLTSDVAAAIWYPYLCNPKDKASAWGEATLTYLREHALNDPSSGCREETLTELFDTQVDEPWWKDAVEYRHPNPSELPPGYVDGYQINSILTDPTLYIDWLTRQFKALGGTLERRAIEKIDEAFADFDTVVNCTALGSRKLFGDNEIYPVRGQVVKVKHNGFEQALVDASGHNNVAYIVPRFNDIVLGGTDQKDNWSLEVSPEDTKEILRKARELSPRFNRVEILSVNVGLRPARSSVRLEIEPMKKGKHVIHNYGHGGAGYTLSWGCAADVVALAQEIDKSYTKE